MINMLVNEQGQQGEWRYATRRHEQRLGISGNPDNHHTAMNLAALADVLKTNVLSPHEREQVRRALHRGLNYYITEFVHHDGYCSNMVNRRTQASIAGYCEGVKAMLSAAALPDVLPLELRDRVLKLVPHVLLHAYRVYYNARTSDVASYCKWGTTYQVKSIRWGAGLLMDATIASLIWPRSVGLAEEGSRPITPIDSNWLRCQDF